MKIADFGLAREIRSRPPYTVRQHAVVQSAGGVAQVAVLQRPIDLFALGAIIAELYTLRPLFPGSSEADEVVKMCSILGTPTAELVGEFAWRRTCPSGSRSMRRCPCPRS